MITIVLVSWNHLETTTAPCLESVRRFTDSRYRVLCIDNGSTDGTPEYLTALARRDPRIDVVLLEENRGWTGGVQEGLKRLPGDTRLICLLNSDTLVTPRWLSNLSAHFDAHPELLVVSPREVPIDEADTAATRARPRLEGAPPLTVPGSSQAPPPSCLEEAITIAARLEQDYRGLSEPALPSGFCALIDPRGLPILTSYLQRFEDYRSKRADSSALLPAGSCVAALDTYVAHARGGSGGYYDYRPA